MQKITLPAHAKINLALDILHREGDYHIIQTVYQKIDLHDDVSIELNDSGKIQCDGKLATQAAEKFFEKITKIPDSKARQKQLQKGVEIKIQKNIPYYSGLGGASSNAAAVLNGLNTIHGDPLSRDDLMQIAAELGMDVPFFVSGFETALGTHYGEKIEKLPDAPNFTMEFYFPEAKKESTKAAYGQLDLSLCGKDTEKTKKLIEALHQNNKKTIIENLHNDFEQLYERPENETKSHTTHQKFILAGAGPTWIKFFLEA